MFSFSIFLCCSLSVFFSRILLGKKGDPLSSPPDYSPPVPVLAAKLFAAFPRNWLCYVPNPFNTLFGKTWYPFPTVDGFFEDFFAGPRLFTSCRLGFFNKWWTCPGLRLRSLPTRFFFAPQQNYGCVWRALAVYLTICRAGRFGAKLGITPAGPFDPGSLFFEAWIAGEGNSFK